MRAHLATTTVAAACACATALVLPLVFPGAAPAAGRHPAAAGPRAAGAANGRGAAGHAAGPAGTPGATRTIALTPLTGPGSSRTRAASVPRGVPARTVRPFSLLGVTWNDDRAPLDGTVEVRTRARSTGTWSGWRRLEPNDDQPDPDSPEGAAARTRGGTAPLWVGDADGVRVRVVPRAAGGRAGIPAVLPAGLRVDLVDPGDPAPVRTAAARARTAASPVADRPRARTAAARPAIVTRAGWGADESLRERGFRYTGAVRAVFVHHTGTGNDYTCAQAPAVVRGIYRYHVHSEGWRDIGYNFLIDTCGTVYEGRAGGVDRPVLGAHTLGFNADTTGVAVIGSYATANPSAASVRALERLAAWKLSLAGVSADATTTLVSTAGTKYPAGSRVRFRTVSGHRDGYPTDCPGARLYDRLPAVRRAAARLQGR